MWIKICSPVLCLRSNCICFWYMIILLFPFLDKRCSNLSEIIRTSHQHRTKGVIIAPCCPPFHMRIPHFPKEIVCVSSLFVIIVAILWQPESKNLLEVFQILQAREEYYDFREFILYGLVQNNWKIIFLISHP